MQGLELVYLGRAHLKLHSFASSHHRASPLLPFTMSDDRLQEQSSTPRKRRKVAAGGALAHGVVTGAATDVSNAGNGAGGVGAVGYSERGFSAPSNNQLHTPAAAAAERAAQAEALVHAQAQAQPLAQALVVPAGTVENPVAKLSLVATLSLATTSLSDTQGIALQTALACEQARDVATRYYVAASEDLRARRRTP